VQRNSVSALIQALNAAEVRYLLVGGLAVVAHGYVRFTADVDVVLDLEENNVRRASSALAGLGYRPRAPVALEEFLDPAKRAAWVRDKGLTVFSLYSPEHLATEVDVFVEAPFDFDQAYARAVRMEMAAGVLATFVGLDDLLALKQRAGRSQDVLDIQHLTAINQDRIDEA
jgi:hypothetical protein